ncbi:uncharacterized protein [Watersipora subatra]|uniref:uncharacterized protein isoform X2 n=1 Tax=Watersipora subatra TaxID=2589382 RepID=UPI00355C7713
MDGCRVLQLLLLFSSACGMDNQTDTVEYVVPEIAADSIRINGVFDNFTIDWNLTSPDPLPPIEVNYMVLVEGYYFPRVLYYNSSKLDESSTPYLTNIDPETLLLITVEPYTKWRTGKSHKVERNSPATIPGVLNDIRMLVRRNLTHPSLIAKWSAPSFTGGKILRYEISLISKVREEVFVREESPPQIEADVLDNTLYNISIRAETSAGFGDWSAGRLYNTSTPSPLPIIYAVPYTPEAIEVKWKSSPLLNDTLYTYSIKYFSDHLDLKFAYVEASNPLYRMVDLKPDTLYMISMQVDCRSDDESLWFAGEQSERTNRAKMSTFEQPQPLEVVAVSTGVISLSWISPLKDQVISFHIKYWPNNTDLYQVSTIMEVQPDSSYTVGLSHLQSDTEYNIVLVLEYPYLRDYTLPAFSVRTNKTAPAAISITSAQCNAEKCWVATSGSHEDTITLRISCGDDFAPLTYEIKYNLQRLSRSELPEDISKCSVVAWSTNSVGKGPESPQIHFTVETETTSNTSLIVGVCVAGVILLTSCLTAYFCFRWRRRKMKSSSQVRYDTHTGMVSMPSTDVNDQLNRLSGPFYTLTENSVYEGEGVLHFRESVVEEKAFLKPYDRSKLTLTKFLGSGAFGEVYAGKAKDIIANDSVTLVAVKTLRADASQSYKEEFVKEAKLMCQFDCENIVRLLGSCIDKDPYYIIIELMNEGDLVAFLRKARPTRAKAGTLSLHKLVSICIDVAAGCKYLEMLHFVHRDLAARNCLVSSLSEESEYQVKLGDFGLARDIYRNDYYRKEGEALLPVRWMSPEALVDGVFTTQSDIWAFGVLMWEAFTLAMQPYPARSNIEVLKFVTNSGTLDKPCRCPEMLFEIMSSCWSYNAADRPTFSNIHQTLTKFLDEEMSDEIITEFDNSNKPLMSENEFFANSTSSGAGENNASAESPVFESEQNLEKDFRVPLLSMCDPSERETTEDTQESSQQFATSSEQRIQQRGIMSSVKKFLQRKTSGHRHLERGQSVPADSGRRVNKYIRSDSTISADRCKTIKTYTESDGRQVSFEESVMANLGEPTMSSIREEKLANSHLRVDVSGMPPTSNETVQYSSINFGSSDKAAADVKDDAAEKVSDKTSDTNTVQYTSIASSPKQTLPEANVQYSTMAFPNHEGVPSAASEAGTVTSVPIAASEAGTVTSVPIADTEASGTVQYSTMNFNANNNSNDNHIPESDSTQVKYSEHAADPKGISRLNKPSLTSSLSDDAIGSAKERRLTMSTPFGAKVDYSSDRFQYHPPLRRQKRLADPSRLDTSSVIFTQTL